MPERPAIRARRPVRLNRRQLVVIAFAIVALALLAAALLWPEDRGTYMPYADFARDLESGQIEQAVIAADGVRFLLHDDPTASTPTTPPPPTCRSACCYPEPR